MAKGYWIACVNIKNQDEFKKYVSDYTDGNSNSDWIENCSKGAQLFADKFLECKK